ncbi:MAG: hypothetical protein HQK49_07220 [Oligoflexia bacterium]|nr:hypothetical protein [Oligoflexia bacterium]
MRIIFTYKFIFKFILTLTLLIIEFNVCNLLFASPITYLLRSPRGLLMGDAYTAIADDEYTLFYNPAALGRHSGLSVFVINPDASVTNALSEKSRFENFPQNDPVAIADRMMGLPLHLHLGGTPGVKIQNVGLNLFAAVNTDIELRNAIHPSLDVDYHYDRGFIIGYAATFGGGKVRGSKRKKAKTAGHKTSIGLAVKNMNRQGVNDSYDLFGLRLLNIISNQKSSDITAIRKELGYSKGSGWGVDTGVEYTYFTNRSRFTVGGSILDMGGTKFVKDEGTNLVPKQEMNVNIGSAFSQDFTIVDYTIAFDLHPINRAVDYRRMVHFGVELGIPFLSIMFGWNGGYVSYGAALEIWPIKVIAGFYSIELGGEYRQEEGQRGLIYVSLLNISFDA